jgi:hypothetical protein
MTYPILMTWPGEPRTKKKMRLIKWTLHTGFVGKEHEGEFEVEDDATYDEIEAEVRETALDCISFEWEEVDG